MKRAPNCAAASKANMMLLFHPAAREEARHAFLYLAAEDGTLADDFEVRLTAALTAIQRPPEACRVCRHNVRRKNLIRFKRHYVAYMI
jgi:plasmid stabilization system protein ParE